MSKRVSSIHTNFSRSIDLLRLEALYMHTSFSDGAIEMISNTCELMGWGGCLSKCYSILFILYLIT